CTTTFVVLFSTHWLSFFGGGSAARPPLPFFLVFQESGIEYPLLSCRWLGLPQPFEHLIHVLLKSVDVRKRRDIVRCKEVLIASVALYTKGQRPRQHRAQGFDHESQAIAFVRA